MGVKKYSVFILLCELIVVLEDYLNVTACSKYNMIEKEFHAEMTLFTLNLMKSGLIKNEKVEIWMSIFMVTSFENEDGFLRISYES